MKKVLLSFVAVTGLFAASFAQTCTSGYTATGIYDDYTSASDPSNPDFSGVYAWGEATLGGDANPNFQAIVSRNSGTGKLDVTMSQGQGEYVPFGIGFGDNAGNGTGTIYKLNLSSDASFTATLTNNAAYNVIFRIAIQDTDGDVIDTYAAAGSDPGGFGNAWMYPIQIVVNAGSTGTISGTFAGGYYANYGAGALQQNVDFTQIKGVNFTIVQESNTGAPNYQPYAISSQSFNVDNVKVGAGACVAGTNKATANISSSKVYPNPVSDMARVELNLKSASAVKVTLSDLMGKEVMTIANGTFSELNKEFSVAGLNKGIYTVNYTIDGEAAKAEMLMVK